MNPFPLGAGIQDQSLTKVSSGSQSGLEFHHAFLFLAIQVDSFLLLHSRDTTGPVGNAGWKGIVRHSTK